MKLLGRLDSEQIVPLLEDRAFVVKFASLLGAIVLLASYLIYSGMRLSQGLEGYTAQTHQHSQTPSAQHLRLDDEEEYADLAAFDARVADHESASAVSSHPSCPAHKKHKKHRILITSSVADTLTIMKRQFHEHPSYSRAIAIAKRYYARHAYSRALKWSMIANEIDDDASESWILFAKSNTKLHRKKDAIRALHAYMRMHPSAKVQAVLNDILKNRV